LIAKRQGPLRLSLSTFNYQPSTFPEGRQIKAGCTCLENRIGIAEVGALPTPSANQQPSTNQSHDDQPTIAKMAGTKIRQTQTTGSDPLAFEGAAGSADIAEEQARLGSVSR
jgi:hypothetical protein